MYSEGPSHLKLFANSITRYIAAHHLLLGSIEDRVVSLGRQVLGLKLLAVLLASTVSTCLAGPNMTELN